VSLGLAVIIGLAALSAFGWYALSRLLAGSNPVGSSNPITYWLAFATVGLGTFSAIVGFLSRQRGAVDAVGITPPWYLFAWIRRSRRVEFGAIRESRLESVGQLKRAFVLLDNGRRFRLALEEFEDPETLAAVLGRGGFGEARSM